MPWIIDTNLLVEGERGDATFIKWLESADNIATADIIRAEFLLGVHAVNNESLRKRGIEFYSEVIAQLPSIASESNDYVMASQLAGGARRNLPVARVATCRWRAAQRSRLTGPG